MIREGRGGRRSQIFPLNERRDFHHCFCCPGNQGQPSGEYSKRTPCSSLLSDPLPCTHFPDRPLAPRPAANFLDGRHHPFLLVTLAQNLNFLLSLSNLMYLIFFHCNILGGHLTIPICHAKGPQKSGLRAQEWNPLHQKTHGARGTWKGQAQRNANRPTPPDQLQTAGVGSPGSPPTAGMSRGGQGEDEGVGPPTSFHRCRLPHGHSGCVTQERRGSARPGDYISVI